jgi:hypothetical protein
MNDRNLEIRRLTLLPAYLAELRVLTGRNVTADELLSAHETLLLRGMLKQIPKRQCTNACIAFGARTSSSFTRMIERLSALNATPVVLWLEKSNDCGALVLQSLRDINFSFPFDAIPDGIFVVATTDGLNRMVLDFSEMEGGQLSLEIELCGPHWSQEQSLSSDAAARTLPS